MRSKNLSATTKRLALMMEKAIALKDDFAEAYSNRGVMLKGTKQVNAAIANFNKAIAIKPDYTEAILGINR